MTRAELHLVTLILNNEVLRLTGSVLIDHLRRAGTNRVENATDSLEMGNTSYANLPRTKKKQSPKGKMKQLRLLEQGKSHPRPLAPLPQARLATRQRPFQHAILIKHMDR